MWQVRVNDSQIHNSFRFADDILFSYISTDNSHALGIDNSGRLWAWGRNNIGQLGDGTTTHRDYPVLISSNQYLAVSAGGEFSAAIRADGSIWTWGNNVVGQLGVPLTIGHRRSPARLDTGLNTFTAVSAGFNHTLAIDSDGGLWGWGNNWGSQLASSSTDSVLPSRIMQARQFSQILAVGSSSFAICGDDTLWAWGNNPNGILGVGSASSTISSPTIVDMGTVLWRPAISASASGGHVLATPNSSVSVFSWGDNWYMQLGNGSYDSANTPQQIFGNITDSLLDIFALNNSSFMIRRHSRGTHYVYHWGRNGAATPQIIFSHTPN